MSAPIQPVIPYHDLFKHMLNGVAYCRMVFDTKDNPVDFVYLYVNPAFEKITGLKQAAIINRRVTDAIPGIKTENPELFDTYGRVVLTGEPAEFEIYVKPLKRWLAVSAYRPKRGHFVAIFENITGRKLTEQALAASDAQARLLLALSNDGIMVHGMTPDGQPEPFIEVNESACQMLGYSRSELLKMSPADIDAPKNPDEIPVIDRLMSDGSVVFERFHIAKNGTRIPVEISSRIADVNGNKMVISIVRDIAERKKERMLLERLVAERTQELNDINLKLTQEIEQRALAQRALEASESHFRSLYEKLLVGYQSLDAEARFLEVNPAWLKTMGYAKEEVIGRWFGDFLAGDQASDFREKFKRFKERGEVETEFVLVRKNGSHALVSVTGRIDYDTLGAVRKTHCLIIDITERRRIEQEIYRLASFPLVNPNPIMRVSPQGELLFANNASRPLMEHWHARIGGLLPEELRAEITEAYSSGLVRNLEVTVGEQTYDIKLYPNFELGALNLYGIDISRRKKIARELEISEANYRMLFNNASDAMILWKSIGNNTWQIIEANRVACERYGYSRDEMLALTGQQLNAPGSYSSLSPAIEQMRRTGYATYELKHITKKGVVIPVEVYGHQFELNGDIVILAVVRDISERKRLEAEKEKYQDRLEAMVEERTRSLTEEIASRHRAEAELQRLYEHEKSLSYALKKQMDERVFFTRALVHELKTPLTPLLGSSEMLVNLAREEPLISLSRNVQSGAVKLRKRIDQLLDLAKGEVGLLKLKFAPVDLGNLLKELVSFISPSAVKKGLAIRLELPPSLPPIEGDRDYLYRVILNLLDNALKFTSSGGQVTIKAFVSGDAIEVWVSDTGIGIPKEKQERLFVPYSRVASDDTEFAGLGLGLSLCKNIIELHGGRIWIESQKDKGTTVRFTLPVIHPKQEKGETRS
ncbi:PAS domain S-box protein [Dehalogenimonas alkenigignens]|uniref:sensor histidine kinase n=1 Tax=Dehalogenimonas alkenigignens TaxID=1217799 RepID=UPI000D56B794|nr:PAS domain S-box protein [Dehalogenimonas alkenigignens]PVV82631.1 hypothetical protein DD509_08405 [Dehalogenimonas alkenigignens]